MSYHGLRNGLVWAWMQGLLSPGRSVVMARKLTM